MLFDKGESRTNREEYNTNLNYHMDNISPIVDSIVAFADTLNSTDGDVSSNFTEFLACVSPIVKWNITYLLSSFTSKKSLIKEEYIRLGISYNTAVEGINKKMQAGYAIRTDGVLGETITSKSHVILEAALRATIEDTEYEKSVCYGRFMANVPFAKEYSSSALTLLGNIIRQVSYKELCLIAFCYEHQVINAELLYKYIKENDDIDASEIFSYLIHLKNIGVYITEGPFKPGSLIGNFRLTYIGNALYEILELNLIGEDELFNIAKLMKKVGLFN